MNTKQTLLVLALSSVLVACGSSSSLNTTKSDNNTTQTGKTDSGKTDNGKTDSAKTDSAKTDNGITDSGKPDNKPNIVGVAGVEGKNKDGEIMLITLSENKDINKITIQGKTMTLLPENWGNGFYKKEYNGKDESGFSRFVSGNEYQYVRFGVTEGHEGSDDKFSIFSQGVATQDMPTSKIFNYKGKAVGGMDDDDPWSEGDASFTVNFGKEKTVTGTLNGWDNKKMPTITVNAKIDGSSFADDSGKVKGNFFGPKATELGGTYFSTMNDGKGIAASFGAKKQ